MTTRETKVLLFNAPGGTIPNPGETGLLDINMYSQAMTDAIGEGWLPLSHTFNLNVEGEIIISLLITRETVAPDHVSL